MKRRRVKITGIGPVTPAGIGKDSFWSGILDSVSRVRRYTEPSNEFGTFAAAYIDNFDIGSYIDRALVPKHAARHTLFAIAGTLLALTDAGVSLDEARRTCTAVITGSCLMDFGGILHSIDSVRERGAKGALGRTMQTMGTASVSSAIVQALGLRAYSTSVSNQCIAGIDALAMAADLIERGEAELVICGASDAPLHRFPLNELRAASMISSNREREPQQVRPFDRWRNTSAPSEGCAIFVVEAETSPRPGYCYFAAGFGNDHGEICSGMIEAAKSALARLRLRADSIDVLSAWGPGDVVIDRGEAVAMTQLFRDHLPQVAAYSIKGAIGSAMGAAPAIQVAVGAMGIRAGAVPPTINWEYPDPTCPLSLSNRTRWIAHDSELVTCHGMGGINGAMALLRC